RENINGIVNFAREIAGVYVGILFEEAADNKVKVSLRSDSRVDVSEIAQKFGGGGHSRAAGCRVQGSLTSVKKAVLDTVAAVLARGDDPAGNY
ncbi:MAG: bifunctional oligoribonuclease/PAP phosphatase NrnA, partial [Firmicutes bacterium]|nr:bifunctional oligoribonuclease/PAP phosphatase NrnA [Bacillota bacterium]